jgi:two-component system nitrate/nitrite response regulator NarL
MRQPSVLKPLTRQHRRVAALVAEGLQNKEIGARLRLTTGTVKQHIYEIFHRTGCQNRTELALAVLRAGSAPQVAAER